MSINVLAFPTQAETICDACKRATHEDHLDGCFRSGDRHCPKCIDSPSYCDKLAIEMADCLARLTIGRACWRG